MLIYSSAAAAMNQPWMGSLLTPAQLQQAAVCARPGARCQLSLLLHVCVASSPSSCRTTPVTVGACRNVVCGVCPWLGMRGGQRPGRAVAAALAPPVAPHPGLVRPRPHQPATASSHYACTGSHGVVTTCILRQLATTAARSVASTSRPSATWPTSHTTAPCPPAAHRTAGLHEVGL